MKSLTSLILGTALVGFLSGCNAKESTSRDLSDDVMKVMAGEDMIMDIKEKSEFLKSMGISKPIDENDRLDVRKDDWTNKYFIFNDYNGSWKSIGEASQKQLENYITKYSDK